jgi:hypothetical protein
MAIAELWERLQEDPAEWHRFFPPAPDTSIKAAEDALGVKLPRSYRRFLKYSNGAVLFGEDRILGVGADLPAELELVSVTGTMRAAATPLPPGLVPFAPTGDGGADCFFTRGGLVELEYPIVFWSPEDSGLEVTHESFDEWLFELTEAMRPSPDWSE